MLVSATGNVNPVGRKCRDLCGRKQRSGMVLYGERPVSGTDNVDVKEKPVSLVLSAATIHCRVTLVCSWNILHIFLSLFEMLNKAFS